MSETMGKSPTYPAGAGIMARLMRANKGKPLSNRGFRMGLKESQETTLKNYCGVFDLKCCERRLMYERCHENYRTCPLVILYAKMGLHCYNLLQGTKFQLYCLKSYMRTVATLPVCYYITLDAMDPTGESSLETFETKVSRAGSKGELILTCIIARIPGERRDCDQPQPMLTHIRMPEWPPENPFNNYCRLKESDIQDNEWIRLYLELAVAPPGASSDALPEVEILNVALGDEGVLNATNATLYIRYNEAAPGKLSDRIAIVRRSFDEDTGCFILVSQTCESSEIITKKRKNVADEEDTGCFILVGGSSEIIPKKV